MKLSSRAGIAVLAFLRPPFFSNPSLRLTVRPLVDVLAALTNRLWIAIEQLGDVLSAAVSEFLRFHRGIAPAIFLGQGIIKYLHVIFHATRIGLHPYLLVH